MRCVVSIFSFLAALASAARVDDERNTFAPKRKGSQHESPDEKVSRIAKEEADKSVHTAVAYGNVLDKATNAQNEAAAEAADALASSKKLQAAAEKIDQTKKNLEAKQEDKSVELQEAKEAAEDASDSSSMAAYEEHETSKKWAKAAAAATDAQQIMVDAQDDASAKQAVADKDTKIWKKARDTVLEQKKIAEKADADFHMAKKVHDKATNCKKDTYSTYEQIREGEQNAIFKREAADAAVKKSKADTKAAQNEWNRLVLQTEKLAKEEAHAAAVNDESTEYRIASEEIANESTEATEAGVAILMESDAQTMKSKHGRRQK